MTIAEQLPEGAIVLGGRADDWRAAIRLAGDALVATGATTDDYTGEMIRAVEDLGPYMVVAPGFALAHARPSPAVLRTGLSWVALAEPVAFGHQTNDPVRLVVGLAALDHDAHIAVMSALATVLADEEMLARALDARTPDEVHAVLESAA